MSTPSSLRLGVLVAVLVGFVPAESAALQPLRSFVDGARTSSNPRREAHAERLAREAEADAALGKNLPGIDVRGIYARAGLDPAPAPAGANAGATTPALGLPQDIYLVNAGLTIPVSVGGWERHAAARAAAGAARAGERQTALEIERRVTASYFDVVGGEAVLRAVSHRLELARSNAGVILARAQEGESSALDVERTRADVARAEQDVAEAGGNVLRARRRLFALTGLEPEPGGPGDLLADDLKGEGPAEAWLARSPGARPAVARAEGERRAAEKQRAAARADWLPTISATLAENYTNATEALGRKDFYSVLGLATWRLDLAKAAEVRRADAVVASARAREAQTRIDAQTAVYDAWVQVDADIAKARAASAGAVAAAHALDLARERYAAGEATQLDVLRAEQDAVEAEVARVRVLADLAYARAALRLAVADGDDPAAR